MEGTKNGSSTIAAKLSSSRAEMNTTSADSNSLRSGVLIEIDPCLSEDEKNFYMKAYPKQEVVRDRRVHCTVCRVHIGTAPSQENHMKMHPILRVTHCNKCHDFYNSGEFSKGEDGSELYCRWCGQGGEVYCCSNCPYVFCKSCIMKNLSKGVVSDIEQNENWRCFSCAPKILWPLRALHWALLNYIEQQKRSIKAKNLSESEYVKRMNRDTSNCCRLTKSKSGNLSDSMESVDSMTSKRSIGSTSSSSKKIKKPMSSPIDVKRSKNNDEVVCTPDLSSMLEPDCQLTVSSKPTTSTNIPTPGTPKIGKVQNSNGNQSRNIQQELQQQQQQRKQQCLPSTQLNSNAPPPLVLRNTGVQMRNYTPNTTIVRKSITAPNSSGSQGPVYHTINGFCIDLNSAAQHETFRLPNGKLIQVKRQTPSESTRSIATPGNVNYPQSIQSRTAIIRPIAAPLQPISHRTTVRMHTTSNNTQQIGPPALRYNNSNVAGNNTVQQFGMGVNGTIPLAPSNQQMHIVNGTTYAVTANHNRPVFVRQIYPNTPFGKARSQLQDQVFNAMEICQHLLNKVQTLTNSNAYKQARNCVEIKDLYIHLSYVLSYGNGRLKSLQDKCMNDMRELGFPSVADSLENGQLAAGGDYVRYAQLEDVDICMTGTNSFHNQIYEYRKSLIENLSGDDIPKEPLSPLLSLRGLNDERDEKLNEYGDNEHVIEANRNGDGVETEVEMITGDIEQNNENWPKIKDEPIDDDEYKTVNESINDNDNDESSTNLLKVLNEESIDNARNDTHVENYEHELQAEEGNGDGDEVGEDVEDEEIVTKYTENTSFNRSTSYSLTNTVRGMTKEEQTHAFDRKLTRLVSQYPSIWCTKDADYGNFDVTRKQWRTIATHFSRSVNIKLRWKNIRKRYVRIERRLREGKRFSGYYDKSMNFLSNRDRYPQRWLKVDCGEDEGGTYNRKELDKIEKTLHQKKKIKLDLTAESKLNDEKINTIENNNHFSKRHRFIKPVLQPIEVSPIDMKIINFVKSNPILWRQSYNNINIDLTIKYSEEQTRRSLWLHLGKSIPNYTYDKIIDRWHYLYEMYKTFRLKTIKNNDLLAKLELKYAKYLAKLYFLYKINENELYTDNEIIEHLSLNNAELNRKYECYLRDMPDDEVFTLELINEIAKYPALWDNEHADYISTENREKNWSEIVENLKEFKHKQASDDEDIEIVEPKTDTINLDSDNDDSESSSMATKSMLTPSKKNKCVNTPSKLPSPINAMNRIIINDANQSINIDLMSTQNQTIPVENVSDKQVVENTNLVKRNAINSLIINDSHQSLRIDFPREDNDDNPNLVNTNQKVDDCESSIQPSPSSSTDIVGKKQPRKKTTLKPNPTLIKQKEIQERDRLEQMKRNDAKLQMKCLIQLKKVEDEFPFDNASLAEKSQIANFEKLSISTVHVSTCEETVQNNPKNMDNNIDSHNPIQINLINNNETSCNSTKASSLDNNDINIENENEERLEIVEDGLKILEFNQNKVVVESQTENEKQSKSTISIKLEDNSKEISKENVVSIKDKSNENKIKHSKDSIAAKDKNDKEKERSTKYIKNIKELENQDDDKSCDDNVCNARSTNLQTLDTISNNCVLFTTNAEKIEMNIECTEKSNSSNSCENDIEDEIKRILSDRNVESEVSIGATSPELISDINELIANQSDGLSLS